MELDNPNITLPIEQTNLGGAVNEKIASLQTRVCAKCEIEKDLEKNFRKVRGNAHVKTCNACMSEKLSWASRNRKDRNRKPETTEKAEAAPADRSDDFIMKIDFVDHKEVFKLLAAQAIEELRTVPDQALWAIKQYVAEKGATP